MKAPRLGLAKLDEQSLAKLQSMEQELDTCILALEPKYPLAKLNADQVSRLQALENELGVVLLAYDGK
jgi:hypothetical protein